MTTSIDILKMPDDASFLELWSASLQIQNDPTVDLLAWKFPTELAILLVRKFVETSNLKLAEVEKYKIILLLLRNVDLETLARNESIERIKYWAVGNLMGKRLEVSQASKEIVLGNEMQLLKWGELLQLRSETRQRLLAPDSSNAAENSTVEQNRNHRIDNKLRESFLVLQRLSNKKHVGFYTAKEFNEICKDVEVLTNAQRTYSLRNEKQAEPNAVKTILSYEGLILEGQLHQGYPGQTKLIGPNQTIDNPLEDLGKDLAKKLSLAVVNQLIIEFVSGLRPINSSQLYSNYEVLEKQDAQLASKIPKAVLLGSLMQAIDNANTVKELLDLYAANKKGTLNIHQSFVHFGNTNTWQLAIVYFQAKLLGFTEAEKNPFLDDPLYKNLLQKNLPQNIKILTGMLNGLVSEAKQKTSSSFFKEQPVEYSVGGSLMEDVCKKIEQAYQKLNPEPEKLAVKPKLTMSFPDNL